MARSEDKEKKEKVLHARIPESLDEEIKERSERLGISVSNLVRNVLQNAFGLVEGLVADSANIARSARGDGVAAPASQAPIPDVKVLGWQEAVLSLNAVCAKCNALLPRGTRAAIGVVQGPGTPPIQCLSCLEDLIAKASQEATPDAEPKP